MAINASLPRRVGALVWVHHHTRARVRTLLLTDKHPLRARALHGNCL